MKEAKKIANVLINEVFIKDDKCSFINIDCNERSKWKITLCNESIYNGLSGIFILFLELYVKTRDKIYLQYYKMLIRTAIEQTQNTRFEGAFTGWLSPMYPLILEYKYLNTISDKEFFTFTIKKLESLKVDDIDKIKGTDYISGIAGILHLVAIIKLTWWEGCISESVINRFSKALLDRIESGQEKAVENIGIAHGISGIMLGLASSKAVCPELIKKYLLKESQIEISQKDIYKWCWGLPGMIQSRLQILKINHLSFDKEELEKLIKKFENYLSSMIN